MGQQQNIDKAKSIIEAFNASDWDRVRETLGPKSVYNEIGTGRRIEGPDELIELLRGWREAFSEAAGTITSATASGDTVLLEITWEGTHDGPLHGPGGTIPPSGKRQVTPAAAVYEFSDGEIKEMRHYFDMLSLMQQIGAIPEPAQA